MNKKIIALFTALLLMVSSGITVYAKNYHEDDIEKYVTEQMLAANIPGMSMSIVSSGKEVYSAAFGDVTEATSDMEIGGLSKNFTALAVMQLYESGKIDLEKKVVEYLPEYSQLGDVTILELLNQTSGIKPEQSFDDISSESQRGVFVDANGNYNILGKVIEKVSGQSYSDYMNDNVFKPLGMNSTYTIDSVIDDASGFVDGHSNYFGLPIKNSVGISKADGWIEAPSAGIVSDVKDIGLYLQMYLNAGGKELTYSGMSEILSKEESIERGKSIFGTDCTYKMGWNYTDKDGEDIYYCNSSIDGYTSSMFLMPSHDIAVTILCNSSDIVAGDSLIEKTAAGVACLLMGQKAKTIDSNKYLVPHIEVDALYLIVSFLALVPLLTIGTWYRLTKKKKSILKGIADVIIHLIIPTAALIIIPRAASSWSMLKRFLPDAYIVSIGVICVLYAGAIVKLILRIIIGHRKENTDIFDIIEENESLEAEEKASEEITEENEESEDETSADNTLDDLKETVISSDEAETDKKNEENQEESVSVEGDTKEIPDIKRAGKEMEDDITENNSQADEKKEEPIEPVDSEESMKNTKEEKKKYKGPKKIILEPSDKNGE